ncbi:MAG: MBL fold metallo-hydrolase [Pseudomonadota bacterium]
MEFCFFGTSSGAPTLTRNVSGLALRPRQSRGWYLVDCGEGSQHQAQRAGLSLQSLRAVFLTHVHGDHCYGLPGLLASAGMGGRTEPLSVVGPRALDHWLQSVRQHTELHLGYPVEFQAVDEHPSGAVLWEDAQVSVCAHPLSHRVPSFAYAFAATPPPAGLDRAALAALGVPQGPLWGQLQRGEAVRLASDEAVHPDQVRLPPARPQRVVVAGDNDTAALMAACGPADVWVHEATYTAEVLAKVGLAPQHSSAEQIARAAAMQQVPNLVLTHFSARYGDDSRRSPSLADVEAEARAHYPGRLFLARDLAVYELDGEGVLTQRPS